MIDFNFFQYADLMTLFPRFRYFRSVAHLCRAARTSWLSAAVLWHADEASESNSPDTGYIWIRLGFGVSYLLKAQFAILICFAAAFSKLIKLFTSSFNAHKHHRSRKYHSEGSLFFPGMAWRHPRVFSKKQDTGSQVGVKESRVLSLNCKLSLRYDIHFSSFFHTQIYMFKSYIACINMFIDCMSVA